MKKTITFFTTLVVMILMGMSVNAQVLLNEQMDYPVGDSLTAHGWVSHSGTGPISIVSGNLSYPGYSTAVGQSALLSSTSGQDINRSFTTQTSGSVYAALLINVTNATTTGDYFFHFFKATSTYVGRVFIKKDATDPTKFTLGVLKGSTAANTVYSTTLLSMNNTHLIVLKYTINAGPLNDVVDLFVNPVTTAEGVPTISASDATTSADLDPFAAIALRQGSPSSAATLTVDGLRVANTWADAIGFTGVTTTPIVVTGTTTGITSTTAICAGDVSADGGAIVTDRGICYGIAVNPDTNGTKVSVTGTIGAFTANITGLTLGTVYHYRAYAQNSVGVSYGEDSVFTTATGVIAPVVFTGAASAILSTTATVEGDVNNDGGAILIEKGICYGITMDPDISGSKVVVSGTAVGPFSGNLTGLTASTLYHARAYATNSVGTGYGADITFTTQVAGIPCATIAELRSKTADNSTIYQLTGEAVLTCKIANRFQKYIQDASAAILIDDATNLIGTNYNVGDGITGIKGKLENYFGLLEFHPIANPGAATSTLNVVTPLVLTAANLLDTTLMKNHQAKLITLENITFTDANGSNKFVNGKKYRMTQGSTTDSLFYAYIFNIDYIALNLPSGIGNVTGVVNLNLNKYYITARNKNDISLLTGINEIGTNTIGIYPNPNNGKFTVDVEKVNNGEIKVYSLIGSLILSQPIHASTTEFDLSAFAKGMYFVNYTDIKSGKSWTEKMIIK